jgi:hypothetical protein
MFTQTLAAHKNKNPPLLSPSNITGAHQGGFAALYKKNSQNNVNSNNSNEVMEDLDLGCDEVLVQNNKNDIDFTCN